MFFTHIQRELSHLTAKCSILQKLRNSRILCHKKNYSFKQKICINKGVYRVAWKFCGFSFLRILRIDLDRQKLVPAEKKTRKIKRQNRKNLSLQTANPQNKTPAKFSCYTVGAVIYCTVKSGKWKLKRINSFLVWILVMSCENREFTPLTSS